MCNFHPITTKLRATPLGPKQEVLLSWLQGRQPVGQPVRFDMGEILADLPFQSREMAYSALYRLKAKGFVEVIEPGDRRRTPATLRVLRRLEAV
jgi:hypothetical protein